MKKKIIQLVVFFSFIGLLAMMAGLEWKNTNSLYFEENRDLQMYFFDAGKADCTLIKQNDYFIMIDTGEKSLSKEILDFFKQNQIDHLDYLILTHFDKDHIGSADQVIENIPIDHIIQSNVPKDSTYYENYQSALTNQKIVPITVDGIKEIELGDLKIKIEGSKIIYEKNSSNNSSLITSIEYKDTSYLFMGDVQNARLKDYIASHHASYDFLKVPYHGRYQNKLDQLISKSKPRVALITCSDEENEDSETLSLLKEIDCKYYLTRKGAILLTSDGKKISVKQ